MISIAPFNADGLLAGLRDWLNERDHLRRQVTELQRSNTAYLERARAAEEATVNAQVYEHNSYIDSLYAIQKQARRWKAVALNAREHAIALRGYLQRERAFAETARDEAADSEERVAELEDTVERSKRSWGAAVEERDVAVGKLAAAEANAASRLERLAAAEKARDVAVAELATMRATARQLADQYEANSDTCSSGSRGNALSEAADDFRSLAGAAT